MVVSKKGGLRLLLFASIFVLLAGIFFASAAFDSTRSWHPLQQISTTAGSGVSVDSNDNGAVDNADKVGGLSASELQASGGSGGGSSGRTYTVVILEENNVCPVGFDKKTLGEMAGWNGYAYVQIAEDNLFLGGLQDWNWASSVGSAIRGRVPESWGGYICWKTYDASEVRPPRSTVLAMDEGADCTGYNVFDITGGSGNGWTYVAQAPYGLMIGQLDYWNWFSYGTDTITIQQYHNTHVGKTCWKVDNIS
ncbi:MAG: hypothetical protein Q8Q31_00905 [Nanoarchaeota archaeon]|nr:hypothetical protein [Nanoarchaeota archaeon]